jgi:predicted RNA-binding protein YlqC (UPF0109 family)
MNRIEFAKVIGKGGQTIMHLRNTYGANVKGNDLDQENRLVVVTGTMAQVFASFDVISELMNQSNAQINPTESRLQLLLEHSKAGKVVGPKGSMIQSLKIKSGASQIKIQKDPIEISGIPLRILTIEGHITAVRRTHTLIHELFLDGTNSNYQSNNNYVAFPDNQMIGSLPFSQNKISMSNSLPLNELVKVGVQAETVRQLVEMKSYLSQHFGLDLNVSQIPMSSSINLHQSPSDHFNNGVFNNNINMKGYQQESQVTGPGVDETHFSIPKNSAGGIIGKGGQGLKDLQAEFGVRIYIERDVGFSGQRTVFINSPDEPARLRCQEKILIMSSEPTTHHSLNPTPIIPIAPIPTMPIAPIPTMPIAPIPTFTTTATTIIPNTTTITANVNSVVEKKE